MHHIFEQDRYFAFYPHVQLVRGTVGAAVHDLFSARVFWIKEDPIAHAFSKLATGSTIEDASEKIYAGDSALKHYISLFTGMNLGRMYTTPTVVEGFRPTLLASQAKKHQLFRPGGELTVEITNRCVYDCQYCAGKSTRTQNACACTVWPDQGEPLSLDTLTAAVEHSQMTGVSRMIVRGGEPFLEPERLWTILTTAANLGMQCDLHTTGTLLDDESIRRLADMPLHLVVPIAATDANRFDKMTNRPGSFDRIVSTIKKIDSSSLSFSAKVPANPGDFGPAGETADWIVESGATKVEFIWYAPADVDPLQLQSAMGFSSPAESPVNLSEFIRNSQSQFCYDNASFISFDGKLSPCIGNRAPSIDLNDYAIETVCREKMLERLTDNSARRHMPACTGCEFRMACTACLVRTIQLRGWSDGRYATCNYSPEAATFTKTNE